VYLQPHYFTVVCIYLQCGLVLLGGRVGRAAGVRIAPLLYCTGLYRSVAPTHLEWPDSVLLGRR